MPIVISVRKFLVACALALVILFVSIPLEITRKSIECFFVLKTFKEKILNTKGKPND